MALAPIQPQQQYGPYKAPTLEQITDIVKQLPKPVLNVTPVNKLVQQITPSPTPFSGGTPNVQYPKAIQSATPSAPFQISQTGPNSFGTYRTPIPFQTEYLGQKVGGAQQPIQTAQQGQYKPQQPTKEYIVAMDRRKELATQQRQLVPELKQMTDDQIVEKYVTQFPQFQEYFKLPEDPNKQIIDAIRRDYPEAQSMTDVQILQQRKQHQELSGMDPTAPGAPGTQLEGPLKGMPSTADDTGIMGIPKFGRVKPLAPFDPVKDVGAPNVGKMIANLPSSAVNVASDVGNMVIDPVDTAVGLLKIIGGAGANLGKGALKIFADDQDVENRVAIGIDRMKRKGGVLGQIASILESSEEMADAVGTALQEKYGSSEKIARTMTEDPLGMVSDIAGIIEGGGTLLKRGGKASKASKLAKLGDEIAEFGNASDPYALTMAGGTKGAQKAVESFTTPSKTEGVSTTDRLVGAWNGLDAQTVRMMKDNADLIKQIDEGNINRETLQADVIQIIDDITEEKSQAGKLYQEAYNNPTKYDVNEIRNDVLNSLANQGVTMDETGKLRFDIANSAMANLSTEAKNAIKSRFDDVMDTLNMREELTVEELHNIRKSLNQTKYQDGFETKKAPGVDKLINGINEKLKKVPGFEIADKLYAELATEVAQVKKILTTKDAEGKLQMRGNIKSLLTETGRRKLDVIERYYPGFRRNVEALVAYDDYVHTRTKHKVGLYSKAGLTGTVPGAMIGGPVGALIGAVVGTVLHNFVTDPKRFKNRVVKKLGKKVAKKIEAGKALSRVEKARMEFEAKKLLAKPQLALEYKPDTKTEKVQVVTPEGIVKGQPGAQTLDKQAIVEGKIVQEKTINASPIKIPGKRNPNLPKQVKETGQENVKEPINKVKEAGMEARKAEQQRRANIAKEKQAKIDAFTQAPGETLTNVSQFKKGMITPDGPITETGYNGRKAYYKIAGDGQFTYRYDGKAKAVSQVKIPGPTKKVEELDPWEIKDEKKAPEQEVKTPEQEARERMENEINRLGYGDTEAKLTKEILKIESMEQNVGFVAGKKIKDKEYKQLNTVEFMGKRERMIEKIQEKLGLDANQAKDWYDDKAYNARELKERYQVKQMAQKLYHGTIEEFMEFDVKKSGSGEGSGIFGKGVDLTDNLDIANIYANIVGGEKYGARREFGERINSPRIEQALKGKRNMKTVTIGDAKIFDIHENKNIVNKFLIDKGIIKAGDIDDYRTDFTEFIVSDGTISRKVAKFVKEMGYDGISYPIAKTQLGRGQTGKNYKIFDPKKAQIVKQEMYNTVKKLKAIADQTLTPKQAEARIRKYFTEKELPIIFEEKITTPRGQEAYGKYHDGAITLVKDPIKSTPDHESLHAYFDMFTTKNRQRAILDEVKRKQKITDDVEAEEWLADGFADFVAKRETFTGKIKGFFSDVRKGLKAVFGQEDAVRNLYKDIINKKRPDTVVRTNPKRAPRNEAQGIPYLTTKPIQDIMSEIKGDSVSANHLKNMLGRQYKKQEMVQIMEAIRIAEEKGGKLSKAETLEVMRGEILPLEIEDTARYADYNKLYDNSTYDFDGRPKTYGTTHIYVVPTIDLTSYNNHFSEPDYFGHIRVEDLAKRSESPKNVARVIEVQSDLFQRGEETKPMQNIWNKSGIGKDAEIKILDLQRKILTFDSTGSDIDLIDKFYTYLSKTLDQGKKITIPEEIKRIFSNKNPRTGNIIDIEGPISEYNKAVNEVENKLIPKQVKQLESYANKGAYRKRMVGQEMIYQFTQGKEKIQFPDGVTIAKIEGHDIPIFGPSEITDLGKGYIVQNEYFNIVVNKIISDQKIENDIFDAYVEMGEFQKVGDWREDIDGDKYTKGQMMERAMESYMNLYGIEYQGALQFSLIDPAMFQDFLEIHRGYEILKNIKEKYPHRFADQKALKNTGGIRDDETAKTAINKMRPEHKTIASFYQTELIPYLQKQFGGEFVNEDGGRWLEIDMKKVFGEQKKLGVPAFQTKDDYNMYKQYLQEEGGVLGGDIIKIAERSNNPLKAIKAEMNDLEIMDQFETWKTKQGTMDTYEKFVKDDRYTHYYTNNDGSNVYKYRSPEGELLAEVKVKNGKIIDRDSDVDYEVNKARGYNQDDYTQKKPVAESNFKKELISSKLEYAIDFTEERKPGYKDRFYKIAQQTTRNDIQNFLNDWEKKSGYSANAQFDVQKASVTDALNSFYNDVTYYNIDRTRSTRSRVIDAYMDRFEKNKKPGVPNLPRKK